MLAINASTFDGEAEQTLFWDVAFDLTLHRSH
jgi:hypothetical protein